MRISPRPPHARTPEAGYVAALDCRSSRASAASRRYPPELFARVVREITIRHGFQIVLSGSREEMQLAEQAAGNVGTGAISLAGLFDLAELAALLSMAPLLLSNNSGPVHVAAAVGTPVVDLYALTNPQHAPWLVPHRVLSCDVPCKYCYKSLCPQGHHRCLRGIEPAAVVGAVVELYEQSACQRARQASRSDKSSVNEIVPRKDNNRVHIGN